MDKLVNIIESNIGTFNHRHDIDSYLVASRIKRILGEKGYVMVENMKDAENYFAIKYGKPEQVYEIEERSFNLVVDDVTYNVKLHRYFFNADRIYSVLVSEL